MLTELSRKEQVSRLAQCPADWRLDLHAALERGDLGCIDGLLDKIRDDAALHRVLARLAFDCVQEAMLKLLDGA